MKSANNNVLPPVQNVIDAMKPGDWYHLGELSLMTGVKTTHLQALLHRAVGEKLLQQSRRGSRNIYARPQVEANVEANHKPPSPRFAPRELKGYDTQWRQFRALCEMVRPQAQTNMTTSKISESPARTTKKNPTRTRRKP